MPIRINISLSSGGRFKPVASRTLGDPLITIGRDDECTLTLEDAQKHVSRVHAELQEEGGRYWMKVVSKVNPVIVNGKRLMYGNRVALAEGDAMTIGLYRLEIVMPEVPANAAQGGVDPTEDLTRVRPAKPAPPAPPHSAPAEEATFVPPPKAPPAQPSPPAQSLLPEVAAEAEEATYVPGPKGTPPEPPPPADPAPLPDSATGNDEATYVPPVSARPAPPAPSPGELIAQRLAQFRRPPESTIPDAEPGPPPGANLDFDLSEEETYVPQVAGATPAPAPEAFSEDATYIRPPPPAPAAPAKPEPPAPEAFSEDATYIRRPSPAPAAPAEPAPPAPEAFSEDATYIRQPAAPAAPAAPAPVLAAAPERPAATGGDPLLQAFLQGAGLAHLEVPDPQAFMRDSGAVVRAAVEGIMLLLLARDEARKDLGAGAPETEGGDNPLNSMASPAEIIAFLLDPRRPSIGDSDPVQALGDACGDLRAHQAALLAAMKAAAACALDSVDPKKIEREHGTSLGGLNLTRKSKLWDISSTRHEKLSREMQEDFNSVFGREVLEAYLARIRKGRGGN